MNFVFIAGPYAAESDFGRGLNVGHALKLGQYAESIGLHAFVPHLFGAAGLYGSADERGGDNSRACAINASTAWAAHFGMLPQGQLWVILRPDGSMSDGTQREHARFEAGAASRFSFGLKVSSVIRAHTWAEWEAIMASEVRVALETAGRQE